MTSISTFDITKEPLLDLLRDIQQGKIQLVDFQRSWCWDEERIERVIASVSLGFLVGAVMLLQQAWGGLKVAAPIAVASNPSKVSSTFPPWGGLKAR